MGRESPRLEGWGQQASGRDMLELSGQALAMLERDNSIIRSTENEEVIYELSEEDKENIPGTKDGANDMEY